MLHEQGLDRVAEKANAGASEAIVAFFRNHDLAFRVRRLRFMARQLAETLEHDDKTPKEAVSSIHRSEEHTSELQSLMRISYAVFCLKKKKTKINTTQYTTRTIKINGI